jgi:hypothetical protein
VRTFAVPVGLVLVGVLCLTGCDGSDGAGDVATESSPRADPSDPAGPSTASGPTPRADPGQTCTDLYYPPDHLVPRAIEMVHGPAARVPVSEAEEIVAALSTVAGTAEPALAADIATVRIGVDTQRALAQSNAGDPPDLRAFDAAAHRLDAACATYGE